MRRRMLTSSSSRLACASYSTPTSRPDPLKWSPTLRRPGLIELIVERGAGAIDALPEGIRKNQDAVAETIINNVRKTIIDERALNPKYYDTMSSLLDALIVQRRQDAIDYKKFLEELLDARRRRLATGVRHRLSRLGHERCPARARRLRLGRQRDTHADRRRDHGEQAARLGRQSHEGARRSPTLSVRRCPMDFDRFDELFDLVRARDEYR